MVVKIEPGESDAELSASSDEEYLVARSRRLRSSDPVMAKAWMITARLMFPENFDIQYEAYRFERSEDRPAEAAKYLRVMLEDFEDEARTQQEVSAIVDALTEKYGKETKKDGEFPSDGLVAVYEHLPSKTSRRLLLDAAERAQRNNDDIQHAELTLLALVLLPELVAVHGPALLAGILKKLKQRELDHQDPLLSLLVKKICPKMLSASHLKVGSEVLRSVVHFTLRYICLYVNELLAEKKRSEEGEGPWKVIYAYSEEIGLRMGWSLTEDLGETQSDTLLQRVRGLIHKKVDNREEIFYVSMLGLVRSLAVWAIEAKAPGDGEAVLLEAFVDHSPEDAKSPQLKRRHTTDDERRGPLVTHGALGTKSKLVEAFCRVESYLDLLSHDAKCSTLLDSLGSLDQLMPAVRPLQSALALYRGEYRQSLSLLRHRQPVRTSAEKCLDALRLGSVHFHLGDHSLAAESLMSAALLCTSAPIHQGDRAVVRSALKQPVCGGRNSRHLHFLPFTMQHVLSYCCRLLVYALKDRRPDHDSAIGHVIILLQYIFPEEEDLLYVQLQRIRMKESFCYPILTTYLYHISFLEEFSALVNDPARKVSLDICPQVQRKMGTRGANREEKEEVRTALRTQARKSHPCLDEVIVAFLANYARSVVECLL